MALKRNVGLKGFKYRGGGPMWAWILHRITGLCIVLFVGLHVMASFSMQQSASDIGTALNTVYESTYFQIFIYFIVIYHVLNGLRVIILDTWPALLQYQREVIWLQWLVFVPVYGLTIAVMVLGLLGYE